MATTNFPLRFYEVTGAFSFYDTSEKGEKKKKMQFLLSERPLTVSVPQVMARREYAHDPISFFCMKHQMEIVI